MNNFIFLTKESDALPIADRLQDEGKRVVVGIITEEPVGSSKAKEECRLSLYDNILEKQPAEKVLSWMKTVQKKEDWFVMCDYGDLWPYSERALKMGFTKGIFPTKEGYTLEQDRQAGKAFAKKYYPKLKVAPAHEFKKTKDAIKFLLDQGDSVFVLKSEGSNAETVVPMTDDIDLARRQIIGALESEGKDYEKGGFTLEEKIRNPMEISPIILFWNGKPLFSLVELENKPIGAGNIGRYSGGCQNLTIQTPLDCKLNQIAFPPMVYEMAKKQPGIGIYDAGLLHADGEFYFTEWVAQRWGWDGIFSEIAMCANSEGKEAASRHFDFICEGHNPLGYDFGAAVRMFQTEPDAKRADVYQDGYNMDWEEDVVDQLFFYCIKKIKEQQKERFVSVGYVKDLGVATGAGDTAAEAIEKAYYAANRFAMVGVLYRPMFDFISTAYPAAIMNRYQFLLDEKLIT